jgi:hypothetical protein
VRDAGWFDDPTGAHELRYWDGEAWTDHVADGGIASRSPVDLDADATQASPPPERRVAARRGFPTGWLLVVAMLIVVAVPIVVAIVALASDDDPVTAVEPFDHPDSACEAWWQANVAAARDGWDDGRFSRELDRLADASKDVDAELASLLRTIASDDDDTDVRSSIEAAYQRCVGLHRWRGATDEERAIIGSPHPPR